MEQNVNLCPGCGRELDIPEVYRGRKAECPYCLCKFIIGTGVILRPPREDPPFQTHSPAPVPAPSPASASAPFPPLRESAGQGASGEKGKKQFILPVSFALAALFLVAGVAGISMMTGEDSGEEFLLPEDFPTEIRDLDGNPIPPDPSPADEMPAPEEEKHLKIISDQVETPDTGKPLPSDASVSQCPQPSPVTDKEGEKSSIRRDDEGASPTVEPLPTPEKPEESPAVKAEDGKSLPESEREKPQPASPKETPSVKKAEGVPSPPSSFTPETISLPPGDLRARGSTGTEARYKRVARISGIDVMERNYAFTLPKPDPELQILFKGGAVAFQSRLERAITRYLTPYASTQWLESQIKDPSALLSLTRYKLMTACGVEAVDQVLLRPGGREMLTEILSDQGWLDDLLVTSVIADKSLGIPLHLLCSIYHYDKTSTDPFFRKIAWVNVSRMRGNWKQETLHHRALDVYQAQRQACQEGRMHGSYRNLESWEMMFTTVGWDKRSMDYALKQFNQPQSQYTRACWQIRYLMYNVFGTSVQRREYYLPWRDTYYEPMIRRKVGGVCGALSTYGANSSSAHGVPAFPVGQPGHCAYMVRTSEEGWQTANSVTGNTNARTQFGNGDESFVRLVQAAYSNSRRDKLLRAFYHNWQAEVLMKFSGALLSSGEKRARVLSLNEDPYHLAHWRQLVHRMQGDKKTSLNEWKQVSLSLIQALGLWQRPCWEFLSSSVLGSVKRLSPNEYLNLIKLWHRRMPKKGHIHRIGSRFISHLDAQANGLKAIKDKAGFFRELLAVYTGQPEFGMVLEWGSGALNKKKEGNTLFLQALMLYRQNQKGQLADISRVLGGIIEDAEKRGDLTSFQKTTRFAYTLYPDLFKKYLGLDEKGVKRAPRQKRYFMGKLLSPDAVPAFSAPLKDSRQAFLHAAALQNQGIGYLLSPSMPNPTLTLKLKGRCRLTGLVIMGRYENEKALEAGEGLVVESSVDGKKWDRLTSTQTVRPIHEIDLHRKEREAAYLRFSYKDVDTKKQIALRALRIYGYPLY